jgi:hypothetical protein
MVDRPSGLPDLTLSREEQAKMPERLIYSSPNGDAWYLVRENKSGEVFIRHIPNAPSGGRTREIPLGSFLAQSGNGPEHQELVRLIGTLADEAPQDLSERIPEVLR